MQHNEAKRLRAENREAQERRARAELAEKQTLLEAELEEERQLARDYERKLHRRAFPDSRYLRAFCTNRLNL